MKHKNTLRGGAGPDTEVEDGLEEYRTDERRQAAEKLFEATPEELGDAAVEEAKKDEPRTPDQGDKRSG